MKMIAVAVLLAVAGTSLGIPLSSQYFGAGSTNFPTTTSLTGTGSLSSSNFAQIPLSYAGQYASGTVNSLPYSTTYNSPSYLGYYNTANLGSAGSSSYYYPGTSSSAYYYPTTSGTSTLGLPYSSSYMTMPSYFGSSTTSSLPMSTTGFSTLGLPSSASYLTMPSYFGTSTYPSTVGSTSTLTASPTYYQTASPTYYATASYPVGTASSASVYPTSIYSSMNSAYSQPQGYYGSYSAYQQAPAAFSSSYTPGIGSYQYGRYNNNFLGGNNSWLLLALMAAALLLILNDK